MAPPRATSGRTAKKTQCQLSCWVSQADDRRADEGRHHPGGRDVGEHPRPRRASNSWAMMTNAAVFMAPLPRPWISRPTINCAIDSRGAGDDQPDRRRRPADDQRPGRPDPVAEPAGDHGGEQHPDQEQRERPGVVGQTVQVPGGHRHRRGDRDGLERDGDHGDADARWSARAARPGRRAVGAGGRAARRRSAPSPPPHHLDRLRSTGFRGSGTVPTAGLSRLTRVSQQTESRRGDDRRRARRRSRPTSGWTRAITSGSPTTSRRRS